LIFFQSFSLAKGGARPGAGNKPGVPDRPKLADYWDEEAIKEYFEFLRDNYKEEGARLMLFVGSSSWVRHRRQSPPRVAYRRPKCANHLMSAARYALKELVGEGTSFDPQHKERERIQVSVTRQKLIKNQSR
jgi:hypothetical protein